MTSQPIVHIDFPAHDPAIMSKFYGSVFNWKIQAFPEYDYYTFQGESGPGGGFPRFGGSNAVQAREVLVYINSADIEADLARIEAAGGQALTSKIEIGGGMGFYAFFQDPAGNRVALYTDGAPVAGG
jgi:predicted enzyme related to lactoylglutathione lyase